MDPPDKYLYFDSLYVPGCLYTDCMAVCDDSSSHKEQTRFGIGYTYVCVDYNHTKPLNLQ